MGNNQVHVGLHILLIEFYIEYNISALRMVEIDILSVSIQEKLTWKPVLVSKLVKDHIKQQRILY